MTEMERDKAKDAVLEAAILDCIPAVGKILTGYAVVASYKDAESVDGTGYWRGFMDGQPVHASTGLLRCGLEGDDFWDDLEDTP